jgi:hypothetical protein
MREHRNANVMLACAKSVSDVSHTDAEDELTEYELEERNFAIWGSDLAEEEQIHVRTILDGFFFVKVHQSSRSLGPGWEFYFWLMAECFVAQAKLKRGQLNHDEGFLRILDAGAFCIQRTRTSAQEAMQELVSATADDYVRGILARLPEGRTSRFRGVVEEYGSTAFLPQLVEQAKRLIMRQVGLFANSPASLLAEVRGKAFDVFEILIQQHLNIRTCRNGFQTRSNRSADVTQMELGRSLSAINGLGSVHLHNPEPVRSVHKDAERFASAKVLSGILAKNPGFRKGKNLPNLTKVRLKVKSIDPPAYLYSYVNELVLTLSFAIKIRTAVFMSTALAKAAAHTAVVSAQDAYRVRIERDGKVKYIPLLQYAKERRTIIRVEIGRAHADRAAKVVATSAAFVASITAKIASAVCEQACATATAVVETVLIKLANSVEPPCPSESRVDKIAFACAHLHIQQHELKLDELRCPGDGKLLLNNRSTWRPLPMEKRGVSVRFIADFLSACAVPVPPKREMGAPSDTPRSEDGLPDVVVAAEDAEEAWSAGSEQAVQQQGQTMDNMGTQLSVEEEEAAVERGMSGLVFLWLVQQLTYDTGFSLAELAAAGGATSSDGEPYAGTANGFVTHTWMLNEGQRSFASTDYLALLSVVRNRGPSARTLYCFADVFGLNQNLRQKDEASGEMVKGSGGAGYAGAGGAELAALDAVIRSCGQTLLLIDRWYEPSVLSRLWCLFELERSIKHGIPIHLAMPLREIEGLRLALGSAHPESITPRVALDSLSRIPGAIGSVAHGSSALRSKNSTSVSSGGCVCTRREDMIRLSRRIEMEIQGGFAGLRQRVQLALTYSLVALVQEQARPTIDMLGLGHVVEHARKYGLPTACAVAHANALEEKARERAESQEQEHKAASEQVRKEKEAQAAREEEEWRGSGQKKMVVNGRAYSFAVPERSSEAPPTLAIVVGGTGQGKSRSVRGAQGLAFLAEAHKQRVELSMDALKAACTPFISEQEAIKNDSSIENEEERLAKMKALEGQYQTLVEADQAEIAKKLMSWEVDIVCEFADENNLYDMAVGNSALFPSLKAIADCKYKLRVVAVQCMDSAENIVVGTGSQKERSGQGLGIQKMLVTKGCLVKAAFFLDSMKCLFRREKEEGVVGLVEKVAVLTREKWDSTECTQKDIDSESLMASSFVAAVDRDGDVIPSAVWQDVNSDLQKLFKEMESEEEESQAEFTDDLRDELRKFYEREEVLTLLETEAAAQEYLAAQKAPTAEEVKAQAEADIDAKRQKAEADAEAAKKSAAAMAKVVQKGGDALTKMISRMMELQVSGRCMPPPLPPSALKYQLVTHLFQPPPISDAPSRSFRGYGRRQRQHRLPY